MILYFLYGDYRLRNISINLLSHDFHHLAIICEYDRFEAIFEEFGEIGRVWPDDMM